MHFNAVGDMNAGAWVRKAGVKVGSVTNVKPAQDGKTVIVTLTFAPGQVVRTGDQFSLISKGILGDMYIEDVMGPLDAPEAKEGQLFEGAPFFSLNDLLGGDTMQVISDLASSIKSVADIIKKNETNIDSTFRDLQVTAANARAISQDLVSASKSLPGLSQQLTDSLNGLQKTLESFTDSANNLIASLQGNLTSGSADLAASLKSLKQTSADIQSIVDKLSAKDSIIGTLSSPDTTRSIEDTLKNLNDISSALVKASQDTEKVVAGIRSLLGPTSP